MATLPVPRASLDPVLLRLLASKRLHTARDVLTTIPVDLMELLDLPQPSIEALLRAVAQAVLPPTVSALDMLRAMESCMSHLATQLTFDEVNHPLNAALRNPFEGLDALLHGGIAAGSVTELVGPAGVGKTQLCLQLTAIAATLAAGQPGSQPGSVVYLDTERRFSGKRVRDIASARFPEAYATPASLAALLPRIHVLTPDSAGSLLQQLEELERGQAQQLNTRLVVIDSIAALVKKSDRIAVRQQQLGQQAAVLKSLAERCRIPVVVTNQVTTVFRTPRHDFDTSHRPPTAGGQLSAALGPQWAHAVTTRLVLEGVHGVRWIKVAKSPVAPMLSFAYEVGAGGLKLLDREPVSILSLGGAMANPISNEMF